MAALPSPPPECARVPKLLVRNRVEQITPVDSASTSYIPSRTTTSSGGATTPDGGVVPSRRPLTPPTSSPSSRTGQPDNSPTTPTREFKPKKSGVKSFFTLKEPSAAAWEQFVVEQQKQQGSRGPTSTPVNSVPNKKLPSHVPRVNSKWDGMPTVAHQQGFTSWKNSMDGTTTTTRGRGSNSSGSSGRTSKDKSSWMSRNHSKNNSNATNELSVSSRPPTGDVVPNNRSGTHSVSTGSNTTLPKPQQDSPKPGGTPFADPLARTPSIQTPQLQTPESRLSQEGYFGALSTQSPARSESGIYDVAEPPDVHRDKKDRRRPPAVQNSIYQSPARELRLNAFDDTPPSPESPRTPIDTNYSQFPIVPSPDDEALFDSYGLDDAPPPVPPKSERRNSLTKSDEGSPVVDPGFVFDFDQANAGSSPSSPERLATSGRPPTSDPAFGPPHARSTPLRPPRMQPGRVIIKDSDLATIPESDTASILLRPGFQPSPYNDSNDGEGDTDDEDMSAVPPDINSGDRYRPDSRDRPESRDSLAEDSISLAESDISAQWYQTPQERLGLGGRITRDVAGEPWPLPLDADNEGGDDDGGDSFILDESTPTVGGSKPPQDKSRTRSSLIGVFKKA